MSECKRIITPNVICSESALDAVCKLVASGMKVQPACKFVAEEYQKNYPEDKADWKTLRLQYYRSNPTKSSIAKKVYHDTLFKEEPKTTTSFVNTELFITIDKYNNDIAKLTNRIKQLEEALDEAAKVLNERVMEDSPAPTETPVLKSTLVDRTTIYLFVEKRANPTQAMALKSDNFDNDKLFRLFLRVRNTYLETNPPFSLPKEILEATGIIE